MTKSCAHLPLDRTGQPDQSSHKENAIDYSELSSRIS